MSRPPPEVPMSSQSQGVAGERLDSWKEIARYLNRDVRTVQRWEETDGLPVFRRTEGRQKGSPVYAFTSEIDAWLRKNPTSNVGKEPEPEPETRDGWRTGRIYWLIVSLFILVVGGVVAWLFLNRQSSIPPLRVVNLTSYPGVERFPAFSPDGKQVVFDWNGANQDNHDLYVKFLDGGEPLRLTTHPGMDGWPAWSPDGRLIAFARWALGSPNVEIFTVPALGGAERKIHEFPLPHQPSAYWPALSWTPDGKYLVLPIAPEALGLISLQTLDVRRMT